MKYKQGYRPGHYDLDGISASTANTFLTMCRVRICALWSNCAKHLFSRKALCHNGARTSSPSVQSRKPCGASSSGSCPFLCANGSQGATPSAPRFYSENLIYLNDAGQNDFPISSTISYFPFAFSVNSLTAFSQSEKNAVFSSSDAKPT